MTQVRLRPPLARALISALAVASCTQVATALAGRGFFVVGFDAAVPLAIICEAMAWVRENEPK